MGSLIDKIRGAGSIKDADILSQSAFFKLTDPVPTEIPIIDIAFSGDVDGGLTTGLTFFAGESKSFKSLLGLMCMKAYLDQYEDGIALFYDSERGITPKYLESMGIDIDRVIHVPIEHIEQLKFDISKRLEKIERGNRVFIFIDSIGNLASKKEIDDALDEKSVADMTRAKALNSLWRIVTPQLINKDIPGVVINHTYNTIEQYSKPVMRGGTGSMYSANQVFIITKAQDKKKGEELEGYFFTIHIDKSRFVREKSKFTFNVKFEGGINKWSGLFDIALAGGFITMPKKGWYATVDQETGEVSEKNFRKSSTDNAEFWRPYLEDESFKEFVRKRYQLSHTKLVAEDAE